MPSPKFKKYFPSGIDDYMRFYENITEFYRTIPLFKDCPDPKDNFLFDLAYQVEADYLVSGDKHLLITLVQPSLKVLSLTAFKNAIQNV